MAAAAAARTGKVVAWQRQWRCVTCVPPVLEEEGPLGIVFQRAWHWLVPRAGAHDEGPTQPVCAVGSGVPVPHVCPCNGFVGGVVGRLAAGLAGAGAGLAAGRQATQQRSKIGGLGDKDAGQRPHPAALGLTLSLPHLAGPVTADLAAR